MQGIFRPSFINGINIAGPTREARTRKPARDSALPRRGAGFDLGGR